MSRRRAIFLLASLVMAWMLMSGVVGTGLVGPNRHSIETTFGLTHAQFGLGFAVIQILTSLLVLLGSGRLKRLSGLGVLLAGLAVQVAGFALVFVSRSLSSLIAGWSLAMIGTTLGAVSNNISMQLWPDNPRKGVTLLHAVNAVGKLVGPLIVAVCLTWNWRTSFLAVGLLTLILALAFAASWRTVYPYTQPDAPAEEKAASSPTLLLNPVYWAGMLPFAFIAGGEAAFATLLPVYFVQQGSSPEFASILLTVHLAGLAAGRFITGALNTRVTNNAIIAGCLATGLAIIPVLATAQPLILYPALFLLGMLFSSTWPTYYAQIATFFPKATDQVAYGSMLGSLLGVSGCVYLSSMLADMNLRLALLFGPAMLGVFGVLYFASALSRGVPRAQSAPVPVEEGS